MKKLTSNQYFIANLNNYMGYRNLKSVDELAVFLELNPNRLKAWMSFSRKPNLGTVDLISDKLEVFSFHLIGINIDFQNYHFYEKILNNSREAFYFNFRDQLNKFDIKTASDFVCFFENKFSKHAYYSYNKKNLSKVPSLQTLETMAIFFNTTPSKLIERKIFIHE